MENGGKSDREIRLQIMLQLEEMQAIEEWRFVKRMPSRAAAVRELLRRGLSAEGFEVAPLGKRSASFGLSEKSGLNGEAGE